MLLYPAIDIYDGQCVRLSQGRFDQATVYYKDPLDAAKKWADLGAEWLHVVDLNGAVTGKPVNLKPIEDIMTTVNLPVQIGGGIRSEEIADIFLTMGAGRVVIGSAAIEDPDLVQVLCVKYEDRVAVGLDAKDGKIAIHGWKETVNRTVLEVAQEFKSMGLHHIIYTDITRDGMLTGPNYAALERMIATVGISIIASGGISQIDDLRKLKAIGADGAILGRSLYENTIDLEQALKL